MPQTPALKTANRSPLPKPEREALSSADEAARYIRQLIFDGTLVGGDRIPQDDVGRALGLSRIPVREALVALEREGWITVEPNRGSYVATLTPSAVLDHYELLGFAYGLASRRALEADPIALGERLDEISADLRDTDDTERFSRAAIAFHAAVVDAARSPRIRSMLRATSVIVPGNFFAEVPGAAAVEKKATLTIRKAIAAGDGDGAAAAYQAKLHRHGEQVVALLKARGFFNAHASDG